MVGSAVRESGMKIGAGEHNHSEKIIHVAKAKSGTDDEFDFVVDGLGAGLRACLKSSNKDGNEGKGEDLSRNKEFTLTVFPEPAEFVEPAEKTLYHPTARQHNKFM